ncbi:TPA: MARTX multifunctional-autoprocessing repeats-in-toxin holotoxin RtxA [Vibrio cholerae]|uniref:MARTX multifunctional-autoprocessing repeats-in-toxin holotoxin RtxA n=2 Tax=Gammaproteobacteria TaxID=1236 RepID=UPI0021D24309|nr:MARTX multifunctional-autoprocessing repeats-in-toxin holotoxin RtxA [Vibrio cholerae]MCU4219889.1 MARTX multifunctional-autoprocessing repeats-in-toxin holotoxin RtxA [Vibrio cholerae]HCZ9574300.1 MARTX multifunctional-autoprocessing repeats-in-toxin holotoxin RtxA [Vibrio cholerae]HCZ9599308.1 MARTX multifunctional-autoprocessing repeats-in-toxin holotoxin RtxA [Vibrio cholerae]HCZ9603581.1 MARTX multifunctional-autoprocessing repeats-in-toxin holotoxin RtxA [Vibrio cholerae]HCZ9634961.1 
MGKPFWRSVEYFFTGNYSADDGNNNIVAIGFGGQIHAYGGDDHVTVGSIGATVYTGSGNDTVVGGSAYLKVEDSTGHLIVKGAAGYADINKSGDGNVSFAGAAGGVSIDHLGNHGDVSYGGAAAYNGITRKGLSGNVTFAGAGGYNALWHETNQGNLSFTGAGAGNKLDRTWSNRYQGSHGDVTFDGAGAANSISSHVETGNITFRGAGADNHLVRKGKVGDITLQGAGASNRIERTHQAEDVYTQTRGNIRFEGVGGYNSLYSDVAHGDIHFSGGGAYNTIIRKGSGNDFAKEGMTNAKADEIVLTKAVMGGSWIGQDHHVTAVKSASEPNTYLFAFADSTYTKINKVQLRNDPQTGELKYYSTAWYKEGNHLSNLANQDISDNGGFTAVNINGAYTLSDLKVEHQQSVTVHAVEKSLTEYEWVTYANGAVIDAKEVSLSDAKMGGHAIYADGTKVDVKAVKSNRQPNTYIYAKVLGPYTKIVVVELANDPETGALKYQARSWYKEGDHTANIANQDISSATGYNPMGKGGYSLSDLHYSVNAVRSTSETVADIEEYTDQTLFKPANDSGESSGDVRFNGAGGGNVIKSNVTRGNVHFNGGGIANVILHSSQFGNTEFNGGGAANVIVKSGEEGDLTFRGAGLANVLVHQSQQGKMDVYAGGAVNVLVRLGDGQYLAHLLAYGNISVQKGSGDSRVVMLGGYNTHTQIGSGNGLWLAAGGFNVMTQVGQGDVAAVLAGGANVLTKMGEGELTSGMLGGANVITHISGDNETSNTTAVALGGANILTKKGKGNTLAMMGGGANVLTHVGDGTTTGVMVGGANILTKVGNGDTIGIMLGVGNVLTHVGDGQTLGVMGAAGNIFTKVGDGTSIAVMIGAGNIFTHVGEGNAWALMGGLGNVFTKVGNGDALALMVAEANVFTHIGDGMSVALMLAKGNVATKVGNGTTLAAMVGNANIFTHVGSGSTFAAMIGQANIMTKVGNDLTAALMVGKANIMTHVGDGTSLGLFAGEVNVMTKVGNGTTLAAMFGKANIMTHVGDGLTGVLALGEANIVTKVGDDFMGVVAAAKANVVTHVGDATTAAVLAGKGNILTKVGEGTTVGLLISDVGNMMTHVGDGTTIGIAKGKANLITKVGDGLGVNVAWGQANVFTQVGDGDRYNFAKGEANLITKVGDGQEVSVVQGEANIITHVGNGDDYTGAWGKANVITKVGHGQNVVLAKGEANIVTQVGDGDSFNALWSKGNIVTKVGDGMQVTAAKGQANITTTVGNGLNVTAAYGDANINTKVGDGVSVNVAWGKYNINTKVGDGLNVAVMKGKANANIHVGDGLNINASYAQNNVAIKVGNGDFYSLAVASSNTSSNKLSALFDNIKQTVLGVGGSQAINYLVQGDEASSSGTHKGRGAIATPEITKLDGFQMDAIKEVSSDLGDSLTGSVTKVDTPDLNKMQHALNVDDSSVQASNLIVNGDFELGEHGWQSTHGVEASYAGSVYGVEGEGHGARVTELDTYTNTSLYQDLANLAQGEVIAVSFDFAKRAGLSNNEGIEVLWNGEVVFSSSGDESAWQQKTLKLTAQAGSNRIEFKGTGHNDGLGYILDNVVATSESSQQANAIREHATQNPAAQNALSDKERAEADRQRLEQEKQKQLDAVAGSQSQLESTDQQALENNGQAQRDAVQEESEAITAELTKLAQGLDVLDSQATHTGESGDQWRNEFASGLLAGVQTQLDDAKQLANDKIAEAKQTHADNQNKVKDAVAKSEAGVAKGEQNRAGAEQDIADAQADAEKRKADALAKGKDAQQAESDAHHAVNNAQSRGDRDVQVAENKANQAQADAQGAKQSEGDRPDRQGVTGSGLSGNAHSVEGAGETDSHVNTDSQTNADGRFSEGLTEQEQEALEGATNAVNRLQINAGIRGKNSGSTITSMFTETNSDSIVVPTTASQDVVRKGIRISGVNIQGLGETPHDTAESRVAVRAEKVANIYRWLDSDHPRATEYFIPVPGFEDGDAYVSDEVMLHMIEYVGKYIKDTDNQVPKDQAQALASLFVKATLDYDWDKRVEFLTKLESYGYSFEAPHGENSIVSFWSGKKSYKKYRDELDNAQPDGKKVVFDVDVQGNVFAIRLNNQLINWSKEYLEPQYEQHNKLKSLIHSAYFNNTGFWSSVYATGAQNDVYVIAEGGMRLGNYFWNVELPVLRQLQREGLVGEIRLLDKPVSEYKDVPVDEIGRRLTDAGVAVKIRFDALSTVQQAELLAINPEGYKASTLIELDVKLSAIDSMLRESLPFYSLRTERNLLVQESEEGFAVRPWRGTDGKSKTILLDNPEDAAQQKSIERFILANFDNFEQMPDELFLVDNKVLSHHDGRTRIIAQKEDGVWTYNTNVELMSVTELQDAAHVTGKIRGESYQKVIDALTEYHASTFEHADYELESVEKLLNLRKQIEGYVLGHPDSGRVEAMNSLLNQVNSRLEEVSVLAVSEQSIKAHDSFSRLYDQLDNANLKESKHLYLDGNGNFVTKGKGNLATIDQLGGSDAVLEKVKAAVSHEYGQAVADTIFAGLSANELAKDGKGIDIAGLNKVHQAIEQHMSPVSATMYIWKPSKHSTLGHAALQIGQGRTQLEGQAAADFNQQNYVSWWPLGSKSSNISNILNVATKDQPDLKLRWSDFSQPAHQNDTLEHDVASEENDGFGLHDGDIKLKRFIEKLNAAKGIDASFKEASEGYASVLLGNPDMLETTGIPAHVFQPFVEQWNDTSYDMMDVANRFAQELRLQAQRSDDPELLEKRIGNVVRQFAERALEEIETFKASQADQGRVFRINLEGLDVAAMQAEWHRLSNDPDARYQLLTKNCSSTVAKVLKAGGADKLIGHTWLPKFGVWTPTELFNFGQALQEAQLEIAAKKQSHQVTDVLDALSGNEKPKENVAIENDGTPPRDKESLSPLTRFLNNELYGDKEARRKIGEITQTLLDHAVEKGESQKITLQGEAGRLTGYYHQGTAPREGETSTTSGKVVLFLHGSGSSAEEQASAIRNHYQKQGIDMLAVNLRGYGESDGGPSEKGLYQDARTMFNYLVNDKGIDPSNIIIHGYSMGGPIAADLARYAAQNGQAVSGLLLDRPMPSMTKAITAHEVANPAGIVGAIAKAVNGQFSVEKNLKGLPKETPILLLTDNEGLGEEGEKLRAKLAIAGYNVTGEQTFYGHEASNRLMGQYADQIVSGLFNAEQAAVEAGEVLKGLEKDFKRYGDALKPDTSVPGKSKDIRTTKDFLNGYKNDHAKEIVDGFRSDMSIKQLVDLFVKGNWSAEQKGALAWEIESRALKVTFQNKSEKYNRLFREIASAGVVDAKATEQLAPQLMLLNLSNDGFGGRCDPLSKLVLVAKQLENDGQVGVARQLLEKMYSAAAVLSNPTLYSDSEKANASKLLSSLAAIHAKNPMHDTSMKVWQEKLEGKQALTVNGVVEKITDASANGKPVLLELDAPGHAMAAWAKGSGDDRVYGFYDPNAGIVEFSSAEKFGDYLTRFFGKSDLNMAQSYKLGKNDAGEAIFNRVVVMDGNTLASYKPTFGDKTTMQGILDLPVFDATPMKKPGTSDVDGNAKAVDDTKEALAGGKILHNQNVNDWERVVVTPTADGGESRFDGQIIVQMENDPVVAKAAANLAGKHAESSVVVQLDSDGNYRVVYGDPSKLDGKLRWQLVGHGRDHSESNNTRLSGYSADELAVKLAKFQQSFNQAENINNKPDHISIVGCSLVSDDKQKGFGHQFINAMDANGLRVDVSVRSAKVYINEMGRKLYFDGKDSWVNKAINSKVLLSWNDQGEVVAKDERIRNGIAEGDIDLSRIGVSDVDEPARGAIGDNSDVFDAPEKRKPETEVIANSSSSNQLSYSGNIQVNVGEGEFTAVNWGTSNVGIKVGTGGFKSLAFGDNNVMVHIGDGESKHSVDIGGYQALEGAQMFLGNRNVSFNFGHSNDLILMMDKSIPTPPLVNPFDGAARISGVLQGIATSGEGEDWLAAQEQQWTLSGAKKFVKDMSGLDQSSSVDYTHLVQLNSQNERDSRGLKHDAETTLNKQYNQWLSGNGNSGTSQLSRADKLRQANEKLAFNFAVGGQGADIQVTTGNWNFMFGDNIQSILDTNLGSLFGLMTQQFTATGQAKTTFTYTPQDLPRQLKNKLLGQLAGVGAETTLADIFGVDYTASGQIVSRNGQAVDGVAILKEMLEVIGEFSGDQLQAFVDPAKLLDSLKAGIDMGADGIKSFAETHGLKEKAPEEEKDNSSVSVNGANVNSAQGATVADGNTETAETQDRAFGFNSLNLPNVFATIFSQDKQKEMKSLVENLKQNLTADLLNMKEKTFDFLRNSGHLQGDGDINISLGNYNFNWGGDGKDLGAYLGDNNNFWGGRGDDVFYATGTSNIFTGGEGNDMGVLMGRENMMFGGDGNDTAVVAGRINHVFLGAGDDQSFVFGEGGEIDTGSGRDYVVTSGNFNRVDTGDDQDYSVTIGSNNQVELGAGNDFANIFGNYNRINAGAGNDVVKLMGYHAVLNGGDGDDHLIAAAISKFSQFNGGEGRDLMVLGGYQNTFKGGTDVDSFVVSGDVIDNLVEDIRSEDNIVFNGIDWQKLWFERSGYDLKLSILRDPSNDSDQSKFEHIGSVTFSDYFNGNRAQVVIGMSDKDLSGEREYTMLSDSAIDALVQAMSGFEPQAGDNGFIDSLESKSQAAISMAWSDVVHKKGLMV